MLRSTGRDPAARGNSIQVSDLWAKGGAGSYHSERVEIAVISLLADGQCKH